MATTYEYLLAEDGSTIVTESGSALITGGTIDAPAWLVVSPNPDHYGMNLLATGMTTTGVLTITRITPAGRTTVRGADHVTVMVTNFGVVDTEMPLGVPVIYELAWNDGEVFIQQTPAYEVDTLLDKEFVLRDLFLSASQVLTDWIFGPVPSEDISVRGGIFPVIGRPDPIVVVDVKESTSSTLNIITITRDATVAMKTILNNANPLLLQVPDDYLIGNEGVLYLQPTKTTVRRPIADARRPERVFEISYTQVSPPPATVTFTVTGTTYTQVFNTYDTYHDLLFNEDGSTHSYFFIAYGSTFGYV